MVTLPYLLGYNKLAAKNKKLSFIFSDIEAISLCVKMYLQESYYNIVARFVNFWYIKIKV